jgi:hypothetical protein
MSDGNRDADDVGMPCCAGLRSHAWDCTKRGGIRAAEALDHPETVDHPAHYGGADNPFEAIKVIEAWGLGFCLGNTVKYLSRAGKKDGASRLEDLKKSRWYLDREIARLESGATP